MTTRQPSTPLRLPFLNGIRAIAACVVVLHHAYLQSWPVNLYHVTRPGGAIGTLLNALAFGKSAVPAFIVLSGFCLMLPVVQRNEEVQGARFFLRRCRRILPPYYAALILAFLLDFALLRPKTFTEYDAAYPVTVTGILTHLSLLQNFSPNPYQIAGPLWSIAVEFQIYLLFPLLVVVYRRWGVATLLLLTSTLGYAASFAFEQVGLVNTCSHYIALFGFGMAAAHFALTRRRLESSAAVHACFLLMPLVALGGLATHRQLGSNTRVTDPLMGGLVACILCLATLRPSGRVARMLSIRPLEWLGSISFSLYLVHMPLQQLLWQYVAHPAGWSPTTTFFLMASAGSLLVVCAASLFFQIFERPSIRMRPASRPAPYQRERLAVALPDLSSRP